MAVTKFAIEASHIMMFARSIGDYNPIYHDAEYAKTTAAGSIIAPPTFTEASLQFDPDCVLRPRPGHPWFGSGRHPTGIRQEEDGGGIAGGLHAEQHYEYHRPPVPGDVLSATVKPGRSWEREGRSGKLSFSEFITEFRDQNGELVVTCRTVGVMTHRPPPKQT